ncbi:MAG: competence protein ComEC [Mycobacterium sp.]|nr:competence protein ComEC [Mycobacterium sp.]
MSTPDARAAGHDLRLVPAALTGWGVMAAGIVWGGAASLWATTAAVVVTYLVTRWWRGRQPDAAVWPGVLAVTVVGVAFSIAVTLRVHDVAHHPVSGRVGATVSVVVVAAESPRVVGGGRLMFRGDLRAVDERRLTGRVVVFASGLGYGELTAGRPVAFRARIGAPTRRDLTVAVLTAAGEPTLGRASLVQRIAARVRTAFADAARSALPADQAAMLPALVLGDTSTLTGPTVDEFRTAGLTHLTAVSGANVTIVCGAVLLAAAVVGPRVAVAMAALALTAFVVVVQPSASVLRAAVMGAITLLAIVAHRRRQAIPALSATVLILMIGVPELAVDIGFALSASATAALVVIAPIWSRRLVDRGWPKPVADAASVAVAAQLVTAPLVAGMSGTVSLVSVAANLAVVVVIAPITVIGTAAAALSAFWPAAAQFLVRFTGPELWWLLRVARWASAVPGAVVPVPSGPAGVFCVAAAGIGSVVLWRWRWGRIGVASAALCLFAWAVAGAGAGPGTGAVGAT